MKLYIFLLFIFYVPTFVFSQNISSNLELFRASAMGDFRYVDYWIGKGGSLNVEDRNLNTPLLIAAENGHLDFVSRLLDWKIDINSINSYGYTPLLSALVNNHKSVSLAIFERGASPYISNIYGTSVYSYLSRFGVNNILQYFNTFPDLTPKIGPSSMIYLNSWEKDYLEALYAKDFIKLNLILESIMSMGDTGDLFALKFMGIYYLNNNMPDIAKSYLLLASKKGDDYSSYLLNNISKSNESINKNSISQNITKVNNITKASNITKEFLKCDDGSKESLSPKDLMSCGTTLFFKDYSFSSAFNFFDAAYSKGEPEALYYIGIMKYYGIGTEQDKVGGYIDIKKASINGINQAVEQIERISTADALNYLKNYTILPRHQTRAFMISQGAVFSTIGECDSYSVKNYFAPDYGIENIRICYCFEGNCSNKMTFFISHEIDSLYDMFIKNYASINLVELSHDVK